MGYAIGAGLLTVGLLGLGWLGVVERRRAGRGANQAALWGWTPTEAAPRRHGGLDLGPAGWSAADHAGDAAWSCDDRPNGGGDGGGD